jgi:hypothetical protein
VREKREERSAEERKEREEKRGNRRMKKDYRRENRMRNKKTEEGKERKIISDKVRF